MQLSTTVRKATAASLALVLAAAPLVACGNQQSAQSGDSGNTQLANPWVDADSLEKVSELAGFSFEVPDTVADLPKRQLQAMKGEMAQAIYTNDAGDKIILRKCKKTDEDITGDFTKYDVTDEVLLEGTRVTLTGNQTEFFNATWSDDSYSYAVSSTIGMNRFALSDIAEQLK